MVCNYEQPCDSLCGLFCKATISIKDSLCYSSSIFVDIKLNKPTLQEQWNLDCEMLKEVFIVSIEKHVACDLVVQ